MTPKTFAALVEAAIPILIGVIATLLAFRVMGKKPGQDLRWDEWHGRYGRLLKAVGPLLILFGIFFVIHGLMSAP